MSTEQKPHSSALAAVEMLKMLHKKWPEATNIVSAEIRRLEEQYKNAVYERDLHVSAWTETERELRSTKEQLEACEADRSSLSQSADYLQEQLETLQAQVVEYDRILQLREEVVLRDSNPANKPPLPRTTTEEMEDWNAHIEETWLSDDSSPAKSRD